MIEFGACYFAEGEYQRRKITIRCMSYTTAKRAAKQIIKENPDIDTASVKDRKGNVLKVVKRGALDD